MSISKQVIRQRDFSAGEIDESAARRDDTKIHKAGLKRARNVRPLPTGALVRRPGRTIRYFDGGWHDIVRPVADVTFDVTFAADRFTARLSGGAVVSTLVAPWTAAILDELWWEPLGRRIFVTHRTMHTQVVEYDEDAGTWSIYDYEFRADLGGRFRAPFYRFADYSVTLQPSALSGTITLTASSAIFVAGHVGVIFRYAGRQVQILTVAANGLTATATALEALPPTYRVTLDAGGAAGFLVGEVVESDTTQSRGEVVGVNTGSNTIDITIYKGFSGFVADEYIVGKQGTGVVASQTTTSIPLGAIVFWDEQMMSDVRGWPGTVSSDVSRLILADFAQVENGVIWSAINAPDDLEVTGEADGAIFETLPAVCRVYTVVGGADEFVMTDIGVYWIPISGDSPLAPGSIEFRRISSSGAARVKPVAVADGVIYIGQTKTRVYAIVATGQTARPWEVRHINPFHEELFNSPVSVAASEGDQTANPGKAVYVVNGDGTIVLGAGSPSDEFVGWFLWEGEAQALGVAARFGEVIFTVRYPLASGDLDVVESIDNAMKFDGSIELADFIGTDPLRDSEGDPLLDSTGEAINAESGAALPFANETLSGWSNGFYLGDVPVDSDGRVDIDGTSLSTVVLGWNFTPEIVPFLEAFEGGQDFGQRLRKRKIATALITVKDTQTFEANGRVYASYATGEDWGQAPPERSGTFKVRKRGRSYDPELTISQPIPGSFMLTELTTQLTV